MTDPTAGDALRSAVSRLIFVPPEEERIPVLLARGVTAAHVEQIGHLADHAIAHGTAMATDTRGRPATRYIPALLLLREVFASVEHGIDVPTVMRWSTVAASEPDSGRTRELFTDNLAAVIGRWAAPPPLGSLPDPPLAYAAGLTLDEAHALHAAGGLAPERLQTMAALRGCRLPAGF